MQPQVHEPVWQLPLKPMLTALPAMSLRQALGGMHQTGVSSVFELDEDGRPIRQFNAGWLARLLTGETLNPDAPLEQFMTPVRTTVRSETPIHEAIGVWHDASEPSLCVVDAQGRALAVLEPSILVPYLAESVAADAHQQTVGDGHPV